MQHTCRQPPRYTASLLEADVMTLKYLRDWATSKECADLIAELEKPRGRMAEKVEQARREVLNTAEQAESDAYDLFGVGTATKH